MKSLPLLVFVLLIVLLLSGSTGRIWGMMQYNLGMVSVQHGLVTSNTFKRQDNFDSALSRLENASHYVELLNVDLVSAALRRALADLDTVTSGEDVLCHLAWSNWRAGDLRSATQQYADALRLNPQQTCAWVGLAQLCKAGVEHASVDCSLAPFSVPEPEYVLNWRSDSGVTLLGFDANLADLRAGLPVLVNLYWRDDGVATQGWTAFNDGQWATLMLEQRIVQTVFVENLFPDGAFEDVWGPAIAQRAGISMYNMTSRYAQVRGKYQYWYGTDPQSGRIEPLANGIPELNNSLVLDNLVEGGSTGLASLSMRHCGGRRYVILARVKDSGQGRNGLAIFWYSRGEPRWTNVAPKTSLPEWTPVAGVVQVPDEGAYCKVWLMNWSESGRSFFDDVLVFELPAPLGG